MRVEALQPLTGGINRLRTKGGADPRQLYDLLNGFVDKDGSVVSRPGTVNDYAVAGTRGLCSANGALVVFATSPVVVPAGVTCEVITHPDDATQDLARIHFAGPFLGDASGAVLYVVAEFENSDVFHYWLQHGTTWAAATAYQPGDVVVPTDANGLAYRAKRLNGANVAWAPNVVRANGDVIEPTISNGFYYTASVSGSTPRSGTDEPAWPTEDGATVIEDTAVGAPPKQTTSTTDSGTSTTSTGTTDRYSGCVAEGMLVIERTRGIVPAGTVAEGEWLRRGDGSWGQVGYSQRCEKPGVRLVGNDMAWLDCSTSAPIQSGDGFVLAPAMFGRWTPRWLGAEPQPTVPKMVTDLARLGTIVVQHITLIADSGVEADHVFLASADGVHWWGHHNTKKPPDDPEAGL